MRKICSALLAIALLASTLLAVPFSALALVNNTDTVYTNVDFTESFYDLGSAAYNMEASIADLSVSGTTDVDRAQGKAFAIKYLKVRKANGSDWPNGFYIADSTGTEKFQFKKGVTYKISYNLRRTKTLSAGIAVFMANGGTSNMAEIAPALAYHGGSAGTWALVTYEFTAPNDGAYALAFYTQGYSMVTDSGVYIDDVTVTPQTTITYNGIDSSVQVPVTAWANQTYEDALSTVIGYDFYLDSEYKTLATGVINKTAVTLYAKVKEVVYPSTSITFDEDFYIKGTLSGETYNYSGVAIARGVPMKDPDTASGHGDVIKITRIGNQIYSGKWVGAFKLANEAGNGAFTVTKGEKYTVSYDIKKTKTSASFYTYFGVLATGGGVNDVTSNRIADEAYLKWEAAATNGGWTTITVSFIAPATGDLYMTLRNADVWFNYDNDEVYFDNINVTWVKTHELVIKNYDGASDKTINVADTDEWSSLALTRAGYEFDGFYTDASFTTTVTGNTVGETEIVYAKWINASTEVTFDEPFYVDAVQSGSSHKYYQDKDSFWNCSLADDTVNGKVMKYEMIFAKNISSNFFRQWASATRFTDTAGIGIFNVDQGEIYKVTYDIKKAKAEYDFSVFLTINNGAAISNVCDGVEIAIGTETAETNGEWTTSKVAYFTAPATGSPVLVIRHEGYSRYEKQEIYFDNIKIEHCEDTALVKLENNGGTGITSFKAFEGKPMPTFSVPTKAGYVFEGWYTDSALTVPYKVADVPAGGITLYAKWVAMETSPYSFETGFESTDVTYGAQNDCDNHKSAEVVVNNDVTEAFDGSGRLTLSNMSGEYNSTANRYLSASLVNKNGTPFQLVKGTRYRLSYAVRFSGSSTGTSYVQFATTNSIPSSGINDTNSKNVLSVYSGGSGFNVNGNWYEDEFYFIAEETTKVYITAYTTAPEKIIDIDNVKIKLVAQGEASLLQYYDETGATLIYESFGRVGDEILNHPPLQGAADKEFTGWRIDSSSGKQFVSSTYPATDLKLFASWKTADTVPEVPTTDFSKPVVIDFEDTEGVNAFYNSTFAGAGGTYGLYSVTDNADGAHTGSGYFRYHKVGHWMKEYYRRMHFFHDASVGNRVWLEPNTAYKVTYYYMPDEVGASNLYLVGFSDKYADGYEILAENYLADGNIFDQFGKWVKYETVVYTGENPSNMGFVLYGGYFSVSIDDITITKLHNVTVSFNSNGGSEVNDIIQLSEGTVMAPADPEKEGFKFAGWFTDASLKNPFDFANALVSEDITLYAKWEPKKHITVITYEENEVQVDVTPEDSHLDENITVTEKDVIGNLINNISNASGAAWWLWLVIAIAAVVLTGGIIFLIVFLAKRNRKEQK